MFERCRKHQTKARRALLNYLVARMEKTALFDSARPGNFSVAATEKLQPVAP